MRDASEQREGSCREKLDRAREQILALGGDWRAEDVSDPGLAVLEALTWANDLQENRIQESAASARLSLLKLAGLEPQEAKAAKILISAGNGDVRLPADSRLYAGPISFELPEGAELPAGGVSAVFLRRGGDPEDVTELLTAAGTHGVPVFGEHPEPGMSLTLLLDALPAGPELLLYVRTESPFPRNAFQGETPSFAELRWELYTESGWASVAVRDESHAFLAPGRLTVSLQDLPRPARLREGEKEGFALRCTLVSSRYDLAPRLCAVSVNLFEAVQRRSYVRETPLNGGASVELSSDLLRSGELFVYCREERGGAYRFYTEREQGGSEQGRCYTVERLSGDRLRLHFSRESGASAPGRGWGAVRVVCCDRSVLPYRLLGTVCGVENQLLSLPPVGENILAEELMLLLELQDGEGVGEYSFVSPGLTQSDSLGYTLVPEESAIRIYNPGSAIGGRLYLCNLATCSGARGNVRAGLSLVSERDGRVFTNPSPGWGGRDRSTQESLRRALREQMLSPEVCVSPADYAALAEKTPGLCIHKAVAFSLPEENLIRLAVKPWSAERFPQLSAIYGNSILRWIDPHRLIGTRVELMHPCYVPVGLRASLVARGGRAQAEERIRQLLVRQLDHVSGDQAFGAPVRFAELYRALSELDCVERIQALELVPEANGAAEKRGEDVILSQDALCYAGQIELNVYAES